MISVVLVVAFCSLFCVLAGFMAVEIVVVDGVVVAALSVVILRDAVVIVTELLTFVVVVSASEVTVD